MDLYVLERAFASTHPDSEPMFFAVLEAYKKGMGKEWIAVEKRLEYGEFLPSFSPHPHSRSQSVSEVGKGAWSDKLRNTYTDSWRLDLHTVGYLRRSRNIKEKNIQWIFIILRLDQDPKHWVCRPLSLSRWRRRVVV